MRVTIHEANWNLTRKSDKENSVNLTLVQEQYPRNLIGKRVGEGIYTGQSDLKNFEKLRGTTRKILARIPQKSDIVVLSEHPSNNVSFDLFQNHADIYEQIIVARLGYYDQGRISGVRNSVVAILPKHKPILVDQISFSVEDQLREPQGKLRRGESIHLFETPFGKIAVLSCHDYTHADIIAQVCKHEVELVIVSTFNPASRLFLQYALSDVHRLFCFIIISNIGNFGGSAVVVPFRRIGPKSSALRLGGILANIQGQSTAYLDTALPIARLRQIRRQLSFGEPAESKDVRIEDFVPIAPGESFLKPQPYYRDVIQGPEPISTIKLDGSYEPSFLKGQIKIGLAHLKSMDAKDYLNNFYHISDSEHAPQFIKTLRGHMRRLEDQLLTCKESLDFLVFPEVFLPLEFETCLKRFSKKFNTIVVGGVEYDAQSVKPPPFPEKAYGSNRCFVYVPTIEGRVNRFEYKKLTQSEYDAKLPCKRSSEKPRHFIMERGNHLLRFSHKQFGQFGVLICYDFSHFDIVYTMNRHQTETPPEMLFVVANNPASSLYESCCVSDSHRFYQYIIMCNVAQYGGSGVFGPLKTNGPRQTVLSAGLNAEGISIATIDLSGLQKARETFGPSANSDFMKKSGIYQNCGQGAKNGE